MPGFSPRPSLRRVWPPALPLLASGLNPVDDDRNYTRDLRMIELSVSPHAYEVMAYANGIDTHHGQAGPELVEEIDHLATSILAAPCVHIDDPTSIVPALADIDDGFCLVVRRRGSDLARNRAAPQLWSTRLS